MRRVLFLLTYIIIGIGVATAQTTTVSGIVYSDTDGEPVIGASVLVVGTSGGALGASTDIEGKFSINNVPANATHIRVSYVGMATQEVKIQRGKTMKIRLVEDGISLDEYVVTAYGATKKGSFTGSSSTVNNKTLEKLQVSNVSKALEGTAPGVQVAMQSGQPGSDATIRIRGIGSINSSSAPLIVVDGIPYDGSISAINPSDIERMDVLKDASSTALYGSRAANGVIMITTKKGDAKKSKVTFEARHGVNQRGIGEYDIMKDAGEYMTTFWGVLKNQTGSGEQATADLFTKLGYNPYICDNNAIVDANGVLTSAPLRYNDDWEKEAITDGTRQEYIMTVQGGNDRSTHFLSVGYLDDEGIIRNSDFNRLSFRSNGDFIVNKLLKINGSLAYSRSEQNSQAISNLSNYVNTFMFTQNIAPIYPVYAYDAEGNRIYKDGKPVYDFGDGKYGSRAYGEKQNIVATDDANQNQVLRDNFSGRMGATLNLVKGLQFQVNGGYDLMNTAQNRFQTPSFGDGESAGGRGYKYRNRTQSYTINELLTYKNSFGKHNLDILAGHENYTYEYAYLYNAKTKFFVPDIPEYDNALTMESMSSSLDEYTMESYFGRINYDYNEKYHFSASVRRDGSSRFHKDNRWGTFWSVGGSWVISKEDFMKKAEWINNLTLRTSYGSVGNDNIYYPGTSTSNYYPYKTQYTVSNSDGNFAISPYYIGNPELTWETSYNFNIGLTANLFNDVLNLDVEYFHKKTEDMLYNVPQPMSSGVSYKSENALTMINKGIEYTIGVNIPMPRGMRWSWTFTGTHYKNEVTDIPANMKENGITSSYYNIREGRSVYDFYYYKSAGVDKETGKALWYVDVEREATDAEGNPVLDKDGNAVIETVRETTNDYSNATKYYIGTAIPDLMGGIATEFSWKGIDLSIQTNFQIGGDIYDAMYMGLMHAGSSPGTNWHKDILNAWTPENTNTNVPILDGDQNANTFSDRFLIGADYFNIKNITIGYTLPKKWMERAQIENARIYFSADNVALFSKRDGLDPRQYISGQSQANYSAIRTISAGISLTF